MERRGYENIYEKDNGNIRSCGCAGIFGGPSPGAPSSQGNNTAVFFTRHEFQACVSKGGELAMEDKQGTIVGLISCAVILVIAVFVIVTAGGV